MSDTEYLSPISRAGPAIASAWHRSNVIYADGVDKYFLPETMPVEEVEVIGGSSCSLSSLDLSCSVEDPDGGGPRGDIIELRHVPVCAALTPSPDNIANWRLLLQKQTRETENCSGTGGWDSCPTLPAVYNLETITSLPFNLQATAGVVIIDFLGDWPYYVTYGYCTAELRFAYQSNSPILLNLTGTAAAASIYSENPIWDGIASASVEVSITYPEDNTGTSVVVVSEGVNESEWSTDASIDEDVDITVTLPARVVPGIVRVYVHVETSAQDFWAHQEGPYAEVTIPPTYNLDLDVSSA